MFEIERKPRWRMFGSKWPNLREFAIAVSSAKACTGAAERGFKTAGSVQRKSRALLTNSKTDKLTFVQSNGNLFKPAP